MFPHFWELVIYSCWSYIKQDQRLLPDIYRTYWGNSNDYQSILPTNDDTGTNLREPEHKTNTELGQAAHKGRQLNSFHNYSYSGFFFSPPSLSIRRGLVIGACCVEQKPRWFAHTLQHSWASLPNQSTGKIRWRRWLFKFLTSLGVSRCAVCTPPAAQTKGTVYHLFFLAVIMCLFSFAQAGICVHAQRHAQMFMWNKDLRCSDWGILLPSIEPQRQSSPSFL